MPQITLEVAAGLHEALTRRAGEQGESIEGFALACLATVLSPRQERKDVPAPGEVRCSFCGKPREEIRHMVTGREARICAECVAECSRLLDRGKREAQGESAP